MSALAEGVDSIRLDTYDRLQILAAAQYCTVEDDDFQFYVKREFGAKFAKDLINWYRR